MAVYWLTECKSLSLHQKLIEYLNAEIVLGTICDIDMAIQWLKSTFLYVRMKVNPLHYNLGDKNEAVDMILEGIA